jgi:hypothetical protein
MFKFLSIAAVIFTLAISGLGDPPKAADRPAASSAAPPATKPTSIFDFGLEPLPTAEEDKPAKTDATKSVQPAPSAETPKPVPQSPAVETPKPVTATPPKSIEAAQGSKSAAAPLAGNGDLSDVLKACHVDANGVLTADSVVTLGLKGSEGKHFIITGDVYLAPEPTQFDQGGFVLHLRRTDGKHCIDLSTTGMRVKRILLEGKVVKKFATPMKFAGAPREQWTPFKIDAGEKAIFVHIGDLQGIAKGPIATEGTNVIVLSPGAKLRNLKLKILDE